MTNIVQRYAGQVAIVTGAGSGIGREIALKLSREGARVALWDVSKDSLQAAETQARVSGSEAISKLIDVSSEADVAAGMDEAVSRWGRLDVVVHAAGIVGPTGTNAIDYAASDFRRVVDINLTGSFVTAKHALRYMAPAKYGRILLLASVAGKEGNPGMAGYSASKAGVIGLVKALGKEYATSGVTVNGVAPGVISTPMNQGTDPKMLEYMVAKIPMQRMGTTDEAAAMACWICSTEASFTTGFVFDLSGGRATY
jgi:NAD(P)-dependent dehydrogenase (short-subunit alcohol dehydrogenase family)